MTDSDRHFQPGHITTAAWSVVSIRISEYEGDRMSEREGIVATERLLEQLR